MTTDADADVGTYTRFGTAISFVSSDQTAFSGTLNGTTLTLVSDGVQLVFRK